MKNLILLLIVLMGNSQAGTTLLCKSGNINLFSTAPVQDVDGTSNKVESAYNPANGDIAFNVSINSFEFKKSLMQKHFNEKYMQSEKFPQASFKGRINEKIDIQKDGMYPVSASGILEVHGVKQNRTIKGNIKVSGSAVTLNSEFTVLCKDHNIDIPKLVFTKIAESIRIKVSVVYSK